MAICKQIWLIFMVFVPPYILPEEREREDQCNKARNGKGWRSLLTYCSSFFVMPHRERCLAEENSAGTSKPEGKEKKSHDGPSSFIMVAQSKPCVVEYIMTTCIFPYFSERTKKVKKL